MQRSDFHFGLPQELIADRPLAQRRASRLLCLDGATGAMHDGVLTDVLGVVQPGDLRVLSDTKVIPARLLGRKEAGGKVEVLIERLLARHRALAHVRASKSPKPGSPLLLE